MYYMTYRRMRSAMEVQPNDKLRILCEHICCAWKFVRSVVLNFINVLWTASTHTDPKSTKKTVKLSFFFCAFGICTRKAASRTLMKLAPVVVNFINVLWTESTHTDLKNTKKTVKLSFFFCTFGICTRKAARRTLMKLTPVVVNLSIHQFIRVIVFLRLPLTLSQS